MKYLKLTHIFTIKVSLLFSIVLMVNSFAFGSIQATYYVDPVNGNDLNNGLSTQSAFATIDKARLTVRSINTSMNGDIMVYLRGGTHILTATIVFNEFDSGTNGFNIIYKAYPNEYPIISGERSISGWTVHDVSKNIYKASVGNIFTRQLYVNGDRAIRARSIGGLSNSTFDSIGHTTTDVFLATWKNPTSIEMVYKEKWTNSRCGVSTITLNNGLARLTMKQPGWRYCSNKGLTSATNPWYYENAYELLDSDGEWYLDKTGAIGGVANTLYYKPYPSQDMNNVIVKAPLLERLIVAQGSSKNNPIHDIKFLGIGFEYTTWNRPDGNRGHADAQNNVLLETIANLNIINGAAVTLKYANDFLFEGCRFNRLGGTGINMYAGSANNLIRGCSFENISANGIQIGDYNGWSTPTSENYLLNTDPKLIVKNNDVNNCYFNYCGIDYRSSCAIGVTVTQDMEIYNNEISNMPYIGIHIGWGWQIFDNTLAKNIKVKHNYIYNVMAELDDGAGIYNLGAHGSAQNISQIDSNYVRTSNDHALYFDEGSSWFRAFNNVFDDIISVNINISTPDKHDLSVTGTFADDNTFWNSGTNTVVSPITVVANGNWPATARFVIDNAGLKGYYKYLRYLEIVNDNFNNETVNSVPSNYIINPGSGSVIVSSTPDAVDKSLLLTKSSTSTFTDAKKVFDATRGTIILEAEVMTPSTTSWKNAFYVMDKNSVIAVSIIFREGNLQIFDGSGVYTTIQPFIGSIWYKLRVDLDTENQIYNVYIDNILKVSNKSFRNRVVEISQVQFGIGSGNSGQLYVNNFRVSSDLNYLNNNFNSTPTNTKPYLWTVGTSGGTARVEEFPSATDKSIKLTKTSTANNVQAIRTLEPLSGKIVVYAKVMTEFISDWKNAPYLIDRKGVVALSLIFKDGNIQLFNGSGNYITIQPFTASTWYEIKLALNTESNKVDVYINNELKLEQANFRNNVADISQIQFAIDQNYSGSLFVDDVQVYQADPLVLYTLSAKYITLRAEVAPNTIRKQVNLKWESSEETLNTDFIVQKSKDALLFYPIDTLRIRSITDKRTVYFSKDTVPRFGTNYYRLKVIDKDGKADYTYTVSAKIKETNNSFEVFPNPVSTVADIAINSIYVQKARIRIVNVLGSELLSKTIQLIEGIQLEAIDLSSIISGTYFLEIQFEKESITKKIIKL